MNNSTSPRNTSESQAYRLHDEVDHLNAIVHNLLLIGLGISIFMMVLGIILQVNSGDSLPTTLIPPPLIIMDLLSFQPAGFFTLGLLFLIATPILRVVSSMIIFANDHDWRYTLVTMVVLLIIILSLFLGKE